MNRICKLQSIMNMKKVSPRELAERTGLSEKSIRRYASSFRTPDIFTCYVIADALQVEIGDIWLNF